MRKPVPGVFKSQQQERIRRQLVRMLINKDGNMFDVTAPEWVQVEISPTGDVVWVHCNGITLFRACRIRNPVEIVDNRPRRGSRSKKQIQRDPLEKA
jgi:hypothetical protein